MTAALRDGGGDVLGRARDAWLERGRREASRLQGAGLAFVDGLRRRGREALATRGLPTPRDDDWKYTRVERLAEVDFERAAARPQARVPSSALLGEPALGDLPRLAFVNGKLHREASSLAALPRGVRVLGLGAALAEAPALVEAALGRVAAADVHGFAGLNAALFDDGAVVLVERGATVDAPLYLVYAGVPAGGPQAAFVRNLVVAEEASSVGVIEHYVSAEGPAYLTSAVTEVVVAPGASVTHYRLEEEAAGAFHVGAVEARVERDAHFASHVVAAGGRLARSEVRVVLAAPGAGCVVNGLYLPAGEQHVDCFTAILHEKPHGTSTQLYKGVLSGAARGVWTGRITVARHAQKTSALQTNRNLLLSQRAHVDTRPQLEIHADDVKCSHGAAVGRIDTDALFYLRARGIGEVEARRLLTYAFASEVVVAMPYGPLRQGIERALATGLLGSREVVA